MEKFKNPLDSSLRTCEVMPMNLAQRENLYQSARQKLTAMLSGETDPILKMATISAVLAETFPYYYWVGFYRLLNGELVVGPYHGTTACLRISLDRGVCGAAATQQETMLVPDVEQFPDHIACDTKSRSEVVVPVFNRAGELIAVLDVDSDKLSAFSQVDVLQLEALVEEIFCIY